MASKKALDPMIIKASTQREAFIKTFKYVVENCDSDPRIQMQVNDGIQGVTRAVIHNLQTIISGNPTANNIDLSDLGFVASTRWKRFLNDYFETERFPDFLNQWLFEPKLNSQPGYVCVESGRHTMGGCLLGITGHYAQNKWATETELVIHSRSTMFAPVAGLDLSLGGAILQWAQRVDKSYDMNNATHRWHVDMAQFVNWKMADSNYFFKIYTDDYPDTTLGNSLKMCMDFAVEGTFPKLLMFARHIEKIHRHLNTGSYHKSGKPVKPYYAFIPTNYLPNDEVI